MPTMATDIDMALRMTADTTNVEQSFKDAGTAAGKMASAVDAATDKAEASAKGLDRVAGSADNLDDKAGRATGALGALSSGFELVGMEKYATGLQSASMATDFFSGIGQSATLVLESQRVAQIKSTLAAARSTVVTKAQAAATRAMTIAQKAMNIAMRANPIGLLITAGLLLAALFITLYKRSDTFRGAVQAAGRIGRQALGWVVDKAKAVGSWIADIPGKLDKFIAKLGWAKDLAVRYFDAMTTPARTLYDMVKKVVEWIAKIDFPDVPGWVPGLGRVSSNGRGNPSNGSSPMRVVAGPTVNITVNGALDAVSVAAQLRVMLGDLYRTYGWTDVKI